MNRVEVTRWQAMRREQIVAAIEQITETLKGTGIPFVERQMLHEDRRDLRKELAKIDDEQEREREREGRVMDRERDAGS